MIPEHRTAEEGGDKSVLETGQPNRGGTCSTLIVATSSPRTKTPLDTNPTTGRGSQQRRADRRHPHLVRADRVGHRVDRQLCNTGQYL
jgi:hypothetical protein